MLNPQLIDGLNQSSQSKNSLEIIRNECINAFLEFRKHFRDLPREIVYLALAISDKYLQAKKGASDALSIGKGQLTKLAIACIFIAWKFEGSEELTLRKIISLDQTQSLTKEELIDIELEILITIDYQVPCDHTYAAMVREFYRRTETVRRDIQLVAHCLAFYNQAIRLCSDFVSDYELGPEIVRCFVQRSQTNSRISMVWEMIRRNHKLQRV